jgi:dihydroorotate dehydrogenase
MNLNAVLPRLLGLLPPERAHRLTIRVLAAGLAPRLRHHDDPILQTRLWGLTFPNPVGLAAGFDKDAEAVDALLGLGFGFVETGSVTPLPQPGNPRPRLFRLRRDGAVINRMGFNSKGADAAAARLALSRKGRGQLTGVLGINLGKNKDSADAAADYCTGVAKLGRYADYLVVNVSSPNTPGLRALQDAAPLRALLGAATAARGNLPGRAPPLLVKIAPDLAEEDLAALGEVALAAGIDGIIVSNTTVQRPAGLADPNARETGGLSGRPLFPIATAALGRVWRLTGGRLPLIGVGGIASGADAYEKIRQGASLVQLYTALVYQGPGLVGAIKRDLAARLRAEGFTSLADAVGSAHR